jgi:hypothetical protein
MLLNRAANLERGKLRSGYFYLPRLGQLNAPSYLPVLMSRFVAQYQGGDSEPVNRAEGAEVNDQRFAPFNRRLDEKLARLLREKAPFHVGTGMDEIGGERVAHRLLLPMSDVGRLITHCILMSV